MICYKDKSKLEPYPDVEEQTGYYCPTCEDHWTFAEHTDVTVNLLERIKRIEQRLNAIEQKLGL